MKRVLIAFTVALGLSGCAGANKATIYTENGFRSAEGEWDQLYRAKAEDCEDEFARNTPEMEACFGGFYDADGKVEDAVRSVVALLRSYWAARAAGGQPDWLAVAKQIDAILAELPPEAARVFSLVKGVE